MSEPTATAGSAGQDRVPTTAAAQAERGGLIYDNRYGHLMPTENVRAAVRLLFPGNITPAGKRQIESAVEAWEAAKGSPSRP